MRSTVLTVGPLDKDAGRDEDVERHPEHLKFERLQVADDVNVRLHDAHRRLPFHVCKHLDPAVET